MSSTPHSLANASLGWFHSLLLLAAAATSPPPPLAHNHELGVVSVFHDEPCRHVTASTPLTVTIPPSSPATSIAPCERSILALRSQVDAPSSLPRARLRVHPHGRIAHVEVASPPPSPPHSASVTHHHNPQPQVDNAVSAPHSPASPSAWAHRACRGGITTTITTPFCQRHPPSQSTTAGRQRRLHRPRSPASPSAWAQRACRGPVTITTTTLFRHRHPPDRQDAGGLKSLADKVAKGEAEHDEVERRLQEKQTTLTWFNVDATIPIALQSPARPRAWAQRTCRGMWHHHHHHPVWPVTRTGAACMPSAHAEACITTTVTPSGLRHAHGHSAHAEAHISTVTTSESMHTGAACMPRRVTTPIPLSLTCCFINYIIK
ncbi:hypothetical protein BJV78DRAFT_1288261 [Lactifluus subvellereus]|nr:hypothetical protein BJV78DRAFT_1288261 [Lactifluus subvellereus]